MAWLIGFLNCGFLPADITLLGHDGVNPFKSFERIIIHRILALADNSPSERQVKLTTASLAAKRGEKSMSNLGSRAWWKAPLFWL